MVSHYYRCILAGYQKGVPKQGSLKKIHDLQQKGNENPSKFLEWIYHQTYGKYSLRSRGPREPTYGKHDFYPDSRRKLQWEEIHWHESFTTE
jgi:hypothetical protein